ncbi:MAG: NADP-dependent oxidoreductase [Bacteroidia bacterium]|nr:NADP-dependent oxidoreductase [Bacteroidia bacterium]
MLNRQFLLAARPVGLPDRTCWTYTETPVPVPAEGEVLLKTHYISLDPAMRGWMNEGKSYIRPVNIGEVMRAGTVGEVIESRHPDWAPGMFAVGNGGVQDYHVAQAAHITRVEPAFAPLPVYLGALGMPGLTGYFGLLETGQPKPGETVLVSAAAGAVGSVVGQVAHNVGCRVVGIAGGPDKCAWVRDELGFDEVIDYKHENLRDGLKRTCPQGVDVYFDNVGGDMLDTVLTRINLRARIVICGAISQYNSTTPVKGPANYLSLLVNRARMEGIVVFDNASRYGEGIKQLAKWRMEGRLKSREHIVEGLETFPETLLMLFTGDNFGKLVLKV